MIPTKIDGANAVFHKPTDMTEEECGSLHVRLITNHNGSGRTAMTSAWRPSDAELKALNAGHAVELTIYGSQHPPVYVGVVV